MIHTSSSQRGASMPVVLTITALSIFTLAFAGLSVWAYLNYTDQKENVDAIVSRSVATAEKEQADKLETRFSEREKEPLKNFAGASDYGTLGFRFPKTWSVYVSKDGSDDSGFEAFLSPGVVPPVGVKSSRYATHVTITNDRYEDIIEDYNDQVEDGELKTTSVKANGDKDTGTRLDGNFSDDIRGAAVIFKIRDKTAIIQTDADTFKPDFDKLVQTITFEQ